MEEKWQEEEETRKTISIVLIRQEQSCTSELFKANQDAVSLILLYGTMLLFRTVSSSTLIMSDVQSIYIPHINSGLIRGGQILSKQTDSILLACGSHGLRTHKDPDMIDLDAPRLAQYVHKAWKKHQNTVYWVDINLALKKGLKFYQTRSNAVILHETLPGLLYSESCSKVETGEVIHEKEYASPRPHSKDFLET